MTAEPTVDHRRIAIAQARLDTWTRHRRLLEVEPGRLEALAGAIGSARAALDDLENAAGDRAGARRRLGLAMEALRLAVDTLGRGIAHRAIAREEHAMACGDDDIWTEADACLEARPSRGAAAGRPAIVAAGVDELGRVRLHMSCPGLGRDPNVRVLVRRRVGRRGVYEPIGYARGSTFVDRNPKRCGRYAAYKIEVVRGPMAGATSRRVLADFRVGARPNAFAELHLEPAAPAPEAARARVALRAA